MIKSQRINQVKEYVFEHESVSLEELVKHFGYPRIQSVEIFSLLLIAQLICPSNSLHNLNK